MKNTFIPAYTYSKQFIYSHRWALLCLVFLSSILFMVYDTKSSRDDQEQKVELLRKQLIAPMMVNDKGQTFHLISTFGRNHGVLHVNLYDDSGSLITQYIDATTDDFHLAQLNRNDVPLAQEYNRSFWPIYAGKTQIGSIDIAWENHPINTFSVTSLLVVFLILVSALIALDTSNKKIEIKSEKAVISPKLNHKKTHDELISEAINKMGLDVCLQYICQRESRRIPTNAFAMIRWKRNEGQPSFFSLAELTGLTERNSIIFPIIPWVIHAILEKGKMLQEVNPSHRLFLNVTQKQFTSRDFAKFIHDLSLSMGMPTKNIVIEISERILSKISQEEMDNAWSQWMDIDVEISIDDYGMTSKSKELISRYLVQFVKWNAKWIQQQFDSTHAKDRLLEINKMAKVLGAKSIVYNIETSNDFELLQELDCDFIQNHETIEFNATNKQDSVGQNSNHGGMLLISSN